MARRALPITAATLTATAALLLSACGGDDDKSPDDTKAADAGSSPSASASATTPPLAKRPDITIPSSFQLTFEDWTSSDPRRQAVLDDAEEEVRAGYAAIIANDPDSESVAFYDTEGVRGQTKEWIKSYTDKNLTVIGKLPSFNPRVVLAENGQGAALTYCTDESDAKTRNRKTGKVEGNPAGTNPYVVYAVSLTKNEQGVWQNSSVRSERGKCSR
ncbi:lipoprotein [Streptomyces venetus]|uniref:Lipoprotein n=1 Tax=Streptomyces venetus TaxID=1701086 RepID=A0ABP8FEV5_9ACTN